MVDFSQLQKIETPADIKEQEERAYALQYLKDTDWYVTRQVEIGKVVPEEVRAARQAAREQLS